MTHKGERGMDAAIEQLKIHQQQLDADGILVGVSRQAVDEVLTGIDALKAENERLRGALSQISMMVEPDEVEEGGEGFTEWGCSKAEATSMAYENCIEIAKQALGDTDV